MKVSSWDEVNRILFQRDSKPITGHMCGCIGPRNGEPLCPCRMRYVKVVDGRYVEIIDHGPAS